MTDKSNLYRYILYIVYNSERYYYEGSAHFSKNLLDVKLFKTVAAVKSSIAHFQHYDDGHYYIYTIDPRYQFTYDMFKIGRVSDIVID